MSCQVKYFDKINNHYWQTDGSAHSPISLYIASKRARSCAFLSWLGCFSVLVARPDLGENGCYTRLHRKDRAEKKSRQKCSTSKNENFCSKNHTNFVQFPKGNNSVVRQVEKAPLLDAMFVGTRMREGFGFVKYFW